MLARGSSRSRSSAGCRVRDSSGRGKLSVLHELAKLLGLHYVSDVSGAAEQAKVSAIVRDVAERDWALVDKAAIDEFAKRLCAIDPYGAYLPCRRAAAGCSK